MLGETFLKIAEDDSYTFDAGDKGLFIIRDNILLYNNGVSLDQFAIVSFKSTLVESLGFVLDDLSINPSTLNTLSGVSEIDGNSSLVDVLVQLGANIPSKFTSTYASDTTHIIEHNLDSQNIHVTIFNDSNNVIINDATVQVLDLNRLAVTLSSPQPIRVLVTSY